jgi:hypothetical protein
MNNYYIDFIGKCSELDKNIILSCGILFDKQQQQGETMLKIFRDSQSNNKYFYHFNLFGLKFRVATNTRGFNKYGTYRTNRGRVLNFGRKYMCFIPMFWSI